MKPYKVGMCFRYKVKRWNRHDERFDYYKLLRRKKIKKKKGVLFLYDVEGWEYIDWKKEYKAVNKTMTIHQIRSEHMNNTTFEKMNSDNLDAAVALEYLNN